MIPAAYIIAVLDCCREKMGFTKPNTTEASVTAQASRGNGEAAEEEEVKTKISNIILIFGCPPFSFVPANSTLTVELF